MTSKLLFLLVVVSAIVGWGIMLSGIAIFLIEGFEKKGTVMMTLGAVFASVFMSQIIGMYSSIRSK